MKLDKMKGIGFALLMVLLVGSAFSGCSKKADPAVNEQPANTTQETGSTESGTTQEATSSSGGETVSLSDLFKKAKTYKSFSYEMETTSAAGSFTSQVWFDNGSYKTVMKMPQGESVSIITEGKMITYDPVSKMGMSYTLDATAEKSVSEQQNPMIYEAPDENLKLLGEEKMNGYDCYVIDTTAMGSGGGKLWISKEYGLMMRMEATDSTSGTQMVMNCKNLKLDSVPKGTFDVPKDIQIIEAGALPGSN